MFLIDFHIFLIELEDLTQHQSELASKRLESKNGDLEITKIIVLSFAQDPKCPRCDSSALMRWGKERGLQRYRCRSCTRTFNPLTGTPLTRLRHKDKWLAFADHLKAGSTLEESAQVLGVHRNTAFRWRHRFLDMPKDERAASLAGIVEADETYFLESQKGTKSPMPRKARSRGGKGTKRGLSKEQIPVLICRDRNGNTADFVLEDGGAQAIARVLAPIVDLDSVLCTDGGKALVNAIRNLGVVHKQINLSKNIRVLEGVYHVQNVNAYDSRLKNWSMRFHGVASKYLPSYLGWHRMLDRLGNGATSRDIFAAALGVDSNQRLMMI